LARENISPFSRSVLERMSQQAPVGGDVRNLVREIDNLYHKMSAVFRVLQQISPDFDVYLANAKARGLLADAIAAWER